MVLLPRYTNGDDAVGMFDYVICKVPLPDGFTGKLQTKSLGCDLDTYTITEAGRLMRRYVARREPVPESEWEYTTPCCVLEEIWHEQSKTRPIFEDVDTNYHGTIRFYGHSGAGNSDPALEWHEYKAKFTDGALVGIAEVPEDDTQ